MARKRLKTDLRPVDRYERVVDALFHLRKARDMLHVAGATQAYDATRRAIKSAEGAERHADGRCYRGCEGGHKITGEEG